MKLLAIVLFATLLTASAFDIPEDLTFAPNFCRYYDCKIQLLEYWSTNATYYQTSTRPEIKDNTFVQYVNATINSDATAYGSDHMFHMVMDISGIKYDPCQAATCWMKREVDSPVDFEDVNMSGYYDIENSTLTFVLQMAWSLPAHASIDMSVALDTCIQTNQHNFCTDNSKHVQLVQLKKRF
jgi:hypothetical protein